MCQLACTCCVFSSGRFLKQASLPVLLARVHVITFASYTIIVFVGIFTIILIIVHFSSFVSSAC